MMAFLSSIYKSCDTNINKLLTTESKHNIVLILEVTLYFQWCLHWFLCSPSPTPLPSSTSSIHPSPLPLHLLLSNCSRNRSFISITCRKPAEPKITPILLEAFLYRPIFPVPFSLESVLPSPCLFLKCPSLTSRPHTYIQCFKNNLFSEMINPILETFRWNSSWFIALLAHLQMFTEIRSYERIEHTFTATY